MKGDESWVWIDDQIVPGNNAQVSVFDRGFLYGDSIYETMRSRGRKITFLDRHLERLASSAEGIGLDLPRESGEIAGILQQVVDAAPAGQDAAVRLMVSRGKGPPGLDFEGCQPHLVIIAKPLSPGLHPAAADGIDIIGTTVRRNPKGALDPAIKSGNFLNNIQAYREVQEAGAFEGVMLTISGDVAEATTSNIFWVRAGTVFTPRSEGILAGVTRATVLELLEASGTPFEVGAFSFDHLMAAEEIFLTSTLKGVLPVKTIDGVTLSSPDRGSMTRTVEIGYEERALHSTVSGES